MATDEPSLPSAEEREEPMTLHQRALKRGLDLVGAALGLLVAGWLIGLLWLLASLDTQANGFFRHERVGRHGRRFEVIKLRSMREDLDVDTHVTTGEDPRVTRFGRFLRDTNLDELPQLINVLRGEMSLVGPRPEVPELVDELEGDDRVILDVRPGITGPATLVFLDEEQLLTEVEDPETFNRDVLYPTKVEINKHYVENYALWKDPVYLVRSILGWQTESEVFERRRAAYDGRDRG